MTTCPYCTEGTWLNDTPGLGLCVCVTPAHADTLVELEGASRGLEHALDRLAEAWELTSTGTAGCAERSLAEQIQADLGRVAAALGVTDDQWTHAGDLAEHVSEALDGREAAADALRNYLVRQGLPADPVRLDDPDLQAVYEWLT